MDRFENIGVIKNSAEYDQEKLEHFLHDHRSDALAVHLGQAGTGGSVQLTCFRNSSTRKPGNISTAGCEHAAFAGYPAVRFGIDGALAAAGAYRHRPALHG
jgi:hypothetical protein